MTITGEFVQTNGHENILRSELETPNGALEVNVDRARLLNELETQHIELDPDTLKVHQLGPDLGLRLPKFPYILTKWNEHNQERVNIAVAPTVLTGVDNYDAQRVILFGHSRDIFAHSNCAYVLQPKDGNQILTIMAENEYPNTRLYVTDPTSSTRTPDYGLFLNEETKKTNKKINEIEKKLLGEFYQLQRGI